MERKRFIRLPEVKSQTGLKRSTIYSLVAKSKSQEAEPSDV
jgi:predicted DNA-binding transcriptional regulator AlpA